MPNATTFPNQNFYTKETFRRVQPRKKLIKKKVTQKI